MLPPKNFIPDEGIERITRTFVEWKEEEKFSQIVDKTRVRKEDYNISPSRYIHVSEADEYRNIADIVRELEEIETKSRKVDMVLNQILKKIL